MTRRLVVDDDIVDMAHSLRAVLRQLGNTMTVSEAMRLALQSMLEDCREQIDERDAGAGDPWSVGYDKETAR